VTTPAALLRTAHSAEARRDFEVLIAHALGKSRAYLYAHGDELLADGDLERVERVLRRYRGGTPVAYITGRREFWNLELHVSPAVLIPRPETELLVELALERVIAEARVLDLGTGSGAIALAIKQERSDCSVTATDASADAIAVARRNAREHDLELDLCVGDWYAAVNGTYHVIVSNPPYIRFDDTHLNALVGEPSSALIGGVDGLDALRVLVSGAPTRLETDGHLLVEHGYDQGDDVRRLFEHAGFRHIASHRDVTGHERVTLGQR
jgi:release factor glutamine methyltransferase